MTNEEIWKKLSPYAYENEIKGNNWSDGITKELDDNLIMRRLAEANSFTIFNTDFVDNDKFNDILHKGGAAFKEFLEDIRDMNMEYLDENKSALREWTKQMSKIEISYSYEIVEFGERFIHFDRVHLPLIPARFMCGGNLVIDKCICETLEYDSFQSIGNLKIIKDFARKLKEEGKTICDFCLYLPRLNYSTTSPEVEPPVIVE